MAQRQWFKMEAKDGKGEISIFDEIGKSYFGEDTVSAKDFDRELKALGKLTDLTVRINSPGGDVMEGVGIYNSIDGVKKANGTKVTAQIQGIAASAASYVAMSADKIIAPENTFMLVHEPYGFAFGTQDEMLSAAADLETITDSFVATYAKRTGQTVEQVQALMKEDRLMDAAEAKAMGYVDEVTDSVNMQASFAPGALNRHLRTDAARTKYAAAVDKAKAAKATADAAAAAALKGAPGNVVQFKDHAEAKAAGFAEAQAYAKEVQDLCALAKKPDMALGFIVAATPVAEVRTKLQAALAADTAEPTAGQRQHSDTVTLASRASDPKANGWGKAVAAVNKRLGFSEK
jgi:ATP-dependent Clp protease protease subunit